MGIKTSYDDETLQTIEDIIDEYMVYGGDQFKIDLINRFEDDYSNPTLNHAVLNYMCSI
jgi:hypothetical protein